ncbi:MAG: ribonuclease G, partial [Lactobacillaceae bacterium]
MDENGTIVPAEVKGWNWGAFMYNIFWGIGNKTYLPLLCLIPV